MRNYKLTNPTNSGYVVVTADGIMRVPPEEHLDCVKLSDESAENARAEGMKLEEL